jgi:cytochrome c oxidase cbb3-type subunit 3
MSQEQTGADRDQSNVPGEIIPGHEYDGIQEYDNPMPGWWSWLFILTVVFAVFYILGIHVFDFIPTYEEDLEAAQEELTAIRAAYIEENPVEVFDEARISEYVGAEEHIAAGSEQFMTYCLPCHGDKGQGLIGPNLTDNYWIHGNDNEDLYNVITNGVVEKGMAPWANVLSPEQRAQVVAFIRSLAGTNPPGAKDPQGDLYE